MHDNAIYCKNNILVRQFDEGKLQSNLFDDLIGEATGDVPGLVGMAHIYNNAGLVHMMTGSPEEALEYFDKGIDYSKSSERFVQRMALECNKMILNSYYNNTIEYNDIDNMFKRIFDGMVADEQLPFISARYIMNLLIVALNQNTNWAKQLMNDYKVMELVNVGLLENSIGSGQLLLQLEYLENKLCKPRNYCNARDYSHLMNH